MTAISVVDRIKEYILLNRLGPGDPMPTENALSEQLQVSRSRIREAMKTLSALDIVEVRHGYGTYVGRLSLTAMVESLTFRGLLSAADDQHLLTDVIELRQLIECSLTEVLVHKVSADDLAALRDLANQMHTLAGSNQEFTAQDRDFHLLMMKATHNALAVQLTGAFWDVHAIASASLSGGTDLVATARAHTNIVDAIEARDPAQLHSAIIEHYGPIRERMQLGTSL